MGYNPALVAQVRALTKNNPDAYAAVLVATAREWIRLGLPALVGDTSPTVFEGLL